jgi:cytochrome P450
MHVLEAVSRALATALLEPLLAAGGGDAAHGFARPLPPQVLLTWLNQPSEDWSQINSWCEDAFLQTAARPGSQGPLQGRRPGLWHYSFNVVVDRKRQRHDPSVDPVTGFLKRASMASDSTKR